MEMAIPLRNPTKMGFERKSARAPSRKALASTQSTPVNRVSAEASAR